ncbi:unnamed protein product [Rhizophagus irregularis]|uniref:SRPBCC family protein n=2 Tax=Rhizophagus irregularis TaxID=588596 RepID=A0A915ZP90_9GLOM|nr:unnamed protein product [Rhizophagus irregularis]CAB5194911.1 unnamed protein product [Rhizophagus irregularis]CAB5360443.1 unnamed protein product [Rhizophagus irregularis]CAB5382782.1 unnamed protein product [Rhizophagus irregularis]
MISFLNFPTTRIPDTLSISLVLLFLTGVVTTLVIIILGIFLIPKDRVCSRTAVYSQPQKKIWNTLIKFGSYPQWRSNVIKVEINQPGHIPPDGFEWFREFTPLGNIKFRIVERWENKLLKREIVREKGVHCGSWTIKLEEISENSTRVTITEKISVHNVLYGVMGLITGYNQTIDLFLTDLGAKFEQQVIITDETRS